MDTKLTKISIVGLKELRENMEEYILRIQKGESLTVMRRNKPVFRLTPADVELESDWETVIDFTEINENGVSARELLASLKTHG